MAKEPDRIGSILAGGEIPDHSRQARIVIMREAQSNLIDEINRLRVRHETFQAVGQNEHLAEIRQQLDRILKAYDAITAKLVEKAS